MQASPHVIGHRPTLIRSRWCRFRVHIDHPLTFPAPQAHSDSGAAANALSVEWPHATHAAGRGRG